MKTPSRGHSALCARVERTLVLNRKAGLNFPGVFMEVTGREVRTDALRLEFYDDRLFHDGRGELSWVALGVLADLALGGVTRHKGGPTRRPATVHLAMQMSGAPVIGNLVADAQFVNYTDRTRVTQALSTGTIHAGKALIAHGSGAFVLLGTAAYVASVPARSTARLSNIWAYFVSPGLPPRLKVQSRLVQQERNLAVVRTQIRRADGKLVLEATTQHAAG